MRTNYPLIAISFLLVIYSFNINAGEFYQWVSEDGKIHYSDRQPKTSDAAKTKIKDIPTIKTVKTKPIDKIKFKSNKRPKIRSKPISRCTQTKQKIAKLENKLSLRNKAADFDHLNEQLSELRWTKLRHC